MIQNFVPSILTSEEAIDNDTAVESTTAGSPSTLLALTIRAWFSLLEIGLDGISFETEDSSRFGWLWSFASFDGLVVSESIASGVFRLDSWTSGFEWSPFSIVNRLLDALLKCECNRFYLDLDLAVTISEQRWKDLKPWRQSVPNAIVFVSSIVYLLWSLDLELCKWSERVQWSLKLCLVRASLFLSQSRNNNEWVWELLVVSNHCNYERVACKKGSRCQSTPIARFVPARCRLIFYAQVLLFFFEARTWFSNKFVCRHSLWSYTGLIFSLANDNPKK